ncbi:MAG TPA: thiamine pyrophosphate-dependent enzyme [Candidatus Kapabacteria bacterium]|nr:thiamine pyrophosphate-dependent enzyme [Candidatus Kapabacteria bacterium]
MGQKVNVELYSKFDFTGFDNETIIEWYKINHLGRRLDEKAALYLKMAKGWSYHAPFAGHDGIQLAIGKTFRASKDFLFPYYRDMLTNLVAGITVEEIILNGLSKDTDVAGGGRHMSNHFAKPSIRIQNVSSCTGNHSLHAAGVARAIKKYKGDEIAIYSGGESASSEGYFFEAINAATLEQLPVIFVLQNNQYGISVPLVDQTANQVVSENYRGMKYLHIVNCDGRDPFDSYRAMQEAKEYITSGKGPAMVHADCDRVGSHSNSDRHELYRSEEERNTVHLRDPLMQFRWHILDKKIASLAEVEAWEEENKNLIFAAADKAEAAPDANGNSWNEFILPEPYVKAEDNTEYTYEAQGEELLFIDAINHTLKEEFRSNPDTFMWGQDIGKGGVFNVVKGMPQEFGKERVFNAPIAEDSIVGTANGFSRYNDKIRLVIEGAEFADYFWPAMEQLVEASHDYWRTRGQFTSNMVMRLASGGYIQGGLYHSQNLEGAFATLPGIRIVMPSFADDAVGLLRNAIRSKGVTLFLEPKYLYNFKGTAATMPPDDFVIPFGKAKVRRKGTDITIVSYGTAVHLSLIAAEELAKENINVEVIDLRSLAPWDKDTVFESVKKTGRVLVAHEDKIVGGFGGEISAAINAEMFKYLDAPILRVGSKDVPVGFAKSYETAILPNKNDIIQAVKKTIKF